MPSGFREEISEQHKQLRRSCGLEVMSLAGTIQFFMVLFYFLPTRILREDIHPIAMGLFVFVSLAVLIGGMRFVWYFNLPWSWALVSLAGTFGAGVYERWLNREFGGGGENGGGEMQGRGFDVFVRRRDDRFWKMMIRVKLAGTLSDISDEPISIDLPRGATADRAARMLGRIFEQMDVSPVGLAFRLNGKEGFRDDELHEGDTLEIIGLRNAAN